MDQRLDLISLLPFRYQTTTFGLYIYRLIKYRYFLFGIKPQPVSEHYEWKSKYRYFLFGIKPQPKSDNLQLNCNIVTSFSVSNHNK